MHFCLTIFGMSREFNEACQKSIEIKDIVEVKVTSTLAFPRQLHCDVKCEIDCFLHVLCHLALSRPVFVFCVVGYVRYTTNAHTMGICCVLLEPPINVAYLLQCIAI